MAMKFLSATRDGEFLIMNAETEFSHHLVEFRAEIKAPKAAPSEVTAGAIRASSAFTLSVSFGDARVAVTQQQLDEVYGLLGCQPLPAVPTCPTHLYESSMTPLSAGVWACERCAAAAIVASEVSHVA